MLNTREQPVSKRVQVMGVDRTVYGYESDGFFGDIDSHIANNQGLITEICGLPSGSVFVDVGANIGGTTLLAAAAGARILAIEASPRNADLFELNMRANAVSAQLFRCAAGSAVGEVYFSEVAYGAGNHVEPSGALVVPVRTIDSIVAEAGIDRLDLLKIDVEGYESEVLRGARETLRTFRPTVVMEFNAYAISMHTNESPRLLAEMVLDIAGQFEVDSRGGMKVSDRGSLGTFMYQHMVHGCVNDLIWRPK
ncbi:FkbM family methyltransferase [Rubrivivax benzoatilyticus]|uniref:FkbM family methyltransferase n=2 Tax=Rubrivivax benzoatilyticus TaxID=316997 RepID=A0ABX0HSA8_9BURK|nr:MULTISPECIES: FkbM family methyltransferase [Rubrivivax]NHK97927.1 FkbM family methyltransferase [Rubrivivax benzoatilyticus]